MTKGKIPGIQRVALYIRVSTEEQAIHGYSLEAQRDALEKYAKEHDMFVVDRYIDDGFSARKELSKRKEFGRMMEDVEADKIDLILFIKLDRWFRSVKDYYKIQEILEAHHVNWKTILEDYDTTTSGGQLHINIMLSVAQNESDRTSERIKFVFEDKVRRGEVVTGKWPLGFCIKNKHLVHDPDTIEIVRDLFAHFEEHRAKFGARTYLIEKYGKYIDKKSIQLMLKNPLYKGEYRGITDYCPPIIEPSRFDQIQKYVDAASIRKSPTNRIYLFAGLTECADCGHKMSGRYTSSVNSEYYHYRCNQYTMHQCTHKSLLAEKKIESYLLENITNDINQYIVTQRILNAAPKSAHIDPSQIKAKLSRLKELYVNDLITLDEYRADFDIYQKILEKTPQPSVDFERLAFLEQFAHSDFKAIYVSLNRESKRSMWHNVIRCIQVNRNNSMTIFFT